MTDISFKQVDPGGSDYLSRRVFELVSKELGGDRPTHEIERIIDYHHGTVVLGGFAGDEMVCMNAFMPMRFRDEATDYTGFQSGFSATSSDHRGKGYWPKLLIASEAILADMGGSFIFGYPNALSHPLFVKKLGYITLPVAKSRMALIPGIYGNAFFGVMMRQTAGTLRPDVERHIAWKQRSSDDQIVISETADGIVWGKVRTQRKAGILVRFLEIGSMALSSGANVKVAIQQACRLAGVRFCYLTVNHDNEIAPLLRSQGAGQPIIVKGIGGFNVTVAKINFFGGMMDTY